jgi:ubiquinone/menaquinone biosynthesis C-methylase UbiE
MNKRLTEKLRTEFKNGNPIEETEGIPVFLNSKFTTGDNLKYMKMYNWMSKGYDIAETVVGKLKYGNAINEMRSEIISRLEWKNNCSVLYVSIGTGKDLQFIPKSLDLKSLDLVGADISLGMLQKCQKRYSRQFNLSLVNCCAEDLPFNDNEFDIVFHVGGINFFNDKKLAIKEMIRVAKNETKILVADETADFIEKQYKKSSLSKKYYQDVTFDLKDVLTSVPEGVKELQTELMWNNKFYCITFRK